MLRTTLSLLTSRPWLAIAISSLLSGQAAAEMAGRVNFVLGTVNAINLDGKVRKLAKNDLVYSGERLETGRGRLQIRFTDGSFISLQPDSVFRLDSYTFNQAQPEQGALQFNFLRGGLRTVTGAIGKVNRARYTVRSPVATIGIRGTGYATTLQNGVLTLTVDKGIVNLSNDFGSSNISAGQTFQVEPGEAPHLAPAGVNAVALAPTPDAHGRHPHDDEIASLINSTLNTTEVLAGELTLPREFSQSPILRDSFYPPASATPDPSYTVASRFYQANDSLLIDHVGGFFNTSNNPDSRGGLLQLTTTNNNRINTLFNAGDITHTGLHFSSLRTVGALSLGEWTNGTAATGQLDTSDNRIVLTANEFEPYIIGLSRAVDVGINQGHAVKLNYSLTNATPARSTHGEIGTLSTLNIGLTLSPVVMMDIAMTVDMAQTGRYSLSRTGVVIPHTGNSLSHFQFDNGELRATGQQCAINGCPVTLAAFLAGDNNLGTLYSIDRPDNQIGGVAALTQTGSSTVPITLNNTDSPIYSAVLAGNTNHILQHEHTISAQFAADGSWQSGVVNSSSSYGPSVSQSSTPATSTDTGHIAQTLAWGRWQSGDIAFGDSTMQLNNDGLHYLVGSPTTSNFPTTQLTYNLVGGTQPTVATSNGSLLTTGSLQTGTVSIDFGQQTAALQLGLGFGNTGVNLNGTGTVSTGKLDFTTLGVSVSTNNSTPVGCTSCQANAHGFVAGTHADMVGLGYQVRGVTINQNTNTTISGVGGFSK